jgi:hypothetical protein
MKLGPISPNDVVRCDHLGRRFWARVTGREASMLTLVPISRNVNYYRVRPREVIEHYARRTRGDGRVSTRAIREQDLVAYEQDGQTVLAIVIKRTRMRLRVLPVDLRASARDLRPAQVTGHYARRGRQRCPRGTHVLVR